MARMLYNNAKNAHTYDNAKNAQVLTNLLTSSNNLLRRISIQCNLARARNFVIAFFWNVFSQPYLMKFVLLDNTHFKRKRWHKIERSLSCTEWKSGFTTSRYQDAFAWLVITSLLQVVNRLVASWLFQQTCCNLFQKVVTSLQMTSCNKPDLNRLVATWWNWQACCNLLTSCNKPVNWQLATSLWRFWLYTACHFVARFNHVCVNILWLS